MLTVFDATLIRHRVERLPQLRCLDVPSEQAVQDALADPAFFCLCSFKRARDAVLQGGNRGIGGDSDDVQHAVGVRAEVFGDLDRAIDRLGVQRQGLRRRRVLQAPQNECDACSLQRHLGVDARDDPGAARRRLGVGVVPLDPARLRLGTEADGSCCPVAGSLIRRRSELREQALQRVGRRVGDLRLTPAAGRRVRERSGDAFNEAVSAPRLVSQLAQHFGLDTASHPDYRRHHHDWIASLAVYLDCCAAPHG